MLKKWFSGARVVSAMDETAQSERRQSIARDRASKRSAALAEAEELLAAADRATGDCTRQLIHGHRVLAVLERLTENEHEFEASEFDSAIDCVDRAICAWPDQGGFLVLKGGLLVTQGRFADGLKALADAVERLPSASKSYVGLDAIRTKSSDEEPQEGAGSSAGEAPANGEYVPYSHEHAIISYGYLKEKVIQGHPAAADRFLALIMFHRFRILERGNGLLPMLEPVSLEDRCARGQYLSTIAPELALSDLAQVLADDPVNLGALVARAHLQLEQGKTEGALADLSQAVEHYPTDVASNVLFARALDDNGYTEDAAHVLTTLIDHLQAADPDQREIARVHLYRGKIRQDRGAHNQALPDFDRAIELDANLDEAFRCRGVAYRELGRLDEALRDTSAAIALDPQSATALVSRALAHEKAGHIDAACVDYRATLELDEFDRNRHAHAKARERLAALIG